MAPGAQVRRVDPAGVTPGVDELAPIVRRPGRCAPFPALRNAPQPRGRPRNSTSRCPGRWRRADPAGWVPKRRAHLRDGARRRSRRRPAPSGVDRGHGAMALVDQQHRDAIGGLDGHDRARRVFEQRVAFAENSGASSGGDTRRRVDLLQGREVGEQRGNVGEARAEAVEEPRERIELGDAVDWRESYRTRVRPGSGSGRSAPAA